MATDVTLRVVHPGGDATSALERAKAVFNRVEAACTRFVESSPLMLANARPTGWHDVPVECAWAIEEAARAHLETEGIFDPRVLDALVQLGYDRTLPRGDGRQRPYADNGFAGVPDKAAVPLPAVRVHWRPRVQHVGSCHRVHLGGARVDLGGIGKGLAVRWATHELMGAGDSVMVEAGGDCQLMGGGPSGSGWLVGMEDPHGGADPLAVFELRDLGCATSSTRLRRWFIDGREVHHIIDPRTGLSGGQGLLAVTVIHRDVAWAEVWSKTLFLTGIERIGDLAQERGLAAAWVDVDGTVQINPAARAHLNWEAAHA